MICTSVRTTPSDLLNELLYIVVTIRLFCLKTKPEYKKQGQMQDRLLITSSVIPFLEITNYTHRLGLFDRLGLCRLSYQHYDMNSNHDLFLLRHAWPALGGDGYAGLGFGFILSNKVQAFTSEL